MLPRPSMTLGPSCPTFPEVKDLEVVLAWLHRARVMALAVSIIQGLLCLYHE